jgi:hypothetical protein
MVIKGSHYKDPLRYRLTGRLAVVPGGLVPNGRGRLLHLDLGSEYRAPIFVFSDRHPALDADPDPLLWWFALAKQTFQHRHAASKR